ncbi:MAG: site-2 protease family protein [Polyangiales bacterium]
MNVEPLSLVCRACSAPVPPRELACPGCFALVHKDELQTLASRAAEATSRGDLGGALEAWRTALSFLPPQSRQHAQVRERISKLSIRLDAPAPKQSKLAGGVGAIGLLFVGLTKLPTLLTMLVSIGVYWTAFGWKLAVGLIACMYVHEIGHVVELRRHGIAATAPMFFPGFGAWVRLKQYPNDPREDARVGLAGPRWGMIVSLAVAAVGALAHWPSFVAIGHASALLNLFNLLPLGSLDGGRGFRALDRKGRWAATAAIAFAWAVTHEKLLVLLFLVALIRCFGAAPEQRDRRALWEYVLLVAVLSGLTMLRVPGL